jgi:hypothetical protein
LIEDNDALRRFKKFVKQRLRKGYI